LRFHVLRFGRPGAFSAKIENVACRFDVFVHRPFSRAASFRYMRTGRWQVYIERGARCMLDFATDGSGPFPESIGHPVGTVRFPTFGVQRHIVYSFGKHMSDLPPRFIFFRASTVVVFVYC